MRRASRWLAILMLCLPGAAHADIPGKLSQYEQEAKQISETLPRPDAPSQQTQSRRLVDAQTAFSLGDYDASALTLFDLASKPGADQETALYYLGESLYRKGDKGAARSYFGQVVAANNSSGKYYALSLVRLVEIGIIQQDTAEVETHLAALERITPRLPQVPYVRGKFLFSQGKFDDAIAQFNEVPKGSAWELQAAYFLGTAHVAKKDLPRATEIFTDVTTRKPKTNNDRRVIELSQLALGRVYYERDEPAKSIDSYLLVDRQSDLFPDALYEVGWVYVKGKQFDKALRALELLALSEPTSNKTATVRILEGNLRIRKAQLVRQAQIVGSIDVDAKQDPAVEYDKAAMVFAETHEVYFPSYQALTAMIASNGDPAEYLAQLAERETHVFHAAPPIPEAAAQYLREEPEVQRAVANQMDLGTIQAHLTEAEATIERLEGVLAANDKTVVYPALASRRSRIGEIQGDLISIRNDLADQQLALIAPSGDLAQATSTRKMAVQAYLQQPSPEEGYSARLMETRAGYDRVEEGAAEVSSALDTTQAVAVALRKYVNDPPIDGATEPMVPPEQKASVNTELVATAAEVFAIEGELRQIRREITLGNDLAGAGDSALDAARAQRRQLKGTQDAEHRLLVGYASGSRDANKSKKLAALGDRAARISDTLAQTEQAVDTIVDQAMAQAKITIAAERKNVDAYKAELADQEIESRSLGSTILGASFKDVKAKFYDVIVRTDVGAIDVVWSQKEDADDDLKRLNLSRQRELKQLKDEFKDILDAAMPSPGTPKAAAPPAPV
ncbi:MAG: tetratricopeptide repeat protein, partial [Deltaproteobacteria bacterium]|nr:tetratricopeptide repeat protein [Deltaproteobacteria bacterium]